MDPLTDFFAKNIIGVYFFYGLSFFSMGLAISLEMGHSSELAFGRALRPLAGFGLVHGSHEWLEMFLLLNPQSYVGPAAAWINPIRLFLLASSFLMFIAFGVRLITGPAQAQLRARILLLIVVLYLIGLAWVLVSLPPGGARLSAADVYTRYALAIPGAALTVWGLILHRRLFIQMGMERFGNDLAVAAAAFGLYGGIGQLFAAPSRVFPSEVLNAEAFMSWFGFPIQVFRASMAALAAVFIIRSMRAFEVENHQRIDALRAAQQSERERLEALRAELLHRTVKAQESERQRIARELHDETGQTLTALGMGLRGLAENLPQNPERAALQARQLERLAGDGLVGLQRLISGLHPPQLDDLGLPAALRWYAGEVKKRYGLAVQVSSQGELNDIPLVVRTVLFRIAQEAITNAVRHAHAGQAAITLEGSPGQLRLEVLDNGHGFDVQKTLHVTQGQPSWGLLGMMERAALVGGECRIRSEPGQGTCVTVRIPRVNGGGGG